MEYHDIARNADAPQWLFTKRQCMHCLHPACESACPVARFEKLEAGPVVYHAERCMGCRYCMMACPFGVPTYEWDKPVPYVRKCTFCAQRVLPNPQAAGEPDGAGAGLRQGLPDRRADVRPALGPVA